MVRSLAVGFGAVTMLAAAGSMTPAGQVILGVKHAVAAPGPVAAAPAAAIVVHAKPAAKHAVPARPSPRAHPQARRAAVARQPLAAPAPSGQSLNVSQVLPLLLQSQSSPSLLSQTTSAASPLAGILGGGSSFPDILQQLTTAAPAAEPASAPQQVQVPTPAAPAQSQSAPVSGEQRGPEDKH
jgi:hypothetical protein